MHCTQYGAEKTLPLIFKKANVSNLLNILIVIMHVLFFEEGNQKIIIN